MAVTHPAWHMMCHFHQMSHPEQKRQTPVAQQIKHFFSGLGSFLLLKYMLCIQFILSSLSKLFTFRVVVLKFLASQSEKYVGNLFDAFVLAARHSSLNWTVSIKPTLVITK